MQKVLFYSTQGLSPLHLGQELELIEKEKNKGNEVYILHCNAKLKSCYFNPCHNLLGCAICEGRRAHFHTKMVNEDHIFALKRIDVDIDVPDFESLDDLIAFRYKDVEIGRGVASSVISLERDFNITRSSSRHRDLVEMKMEMAAYVVENLEYYVSKIQPDKIVLFNGRFAELYPIVDFCKKRGIDFICFERASNKKKYQVYKNHLPHSIVARNELMLSLWHTKDEQKKKIAEAWFTSKRAGNNPYTINHLSYQKKDILPEGFDENKINIAVFNSSEDELKTIIEWQDNALYESQNEAIFKIFDHFKNRPEIHFYLRIHPNLAKINNLQMQELRHFTQENITILSGSAAVDTYALIEACDKVLTFASTVGIEATFWGKPAILFGKSFYKVLNATYNPDSYEELFKILQDRDLAPINRETTLPYGYFYTNYGTLPESFKYD
ncbi:MAG: hypothetical protein AAGI49_13535, partial [Bacteroidota bacterium]